MEDKNNFNRRFLNLLKEAGYIVCYADTESVYMKKFRGEKMEGKKQAFQKSNGIRIKLNEKMFTKVNNDIYGNPRYVIHYLCLLPTDFKSDIFSDYEFVLSLNKKLSLGGRKYHNKNYGGGLVFQSYNLRNTMDYLEKRLNKYFQEIV